MVKSTDNSNVFRVDNFYKEAATSTDTQVEEHPDYTEAYDRLRLFSQFATVVHMGSFIAILVGVSIRMANGSPQLGIARVGRIASCWGGLQEDSESFLKDIAYRSITNEISSSQGLDRHVTIATLLVTFFLLSAVFQFLFLISTEHKKSILNNRPQWFRYTEYSLSASCMVVAIFISFGMLDSYLHVTVFVLTFLCMAIGLVADYMRFLSLSTGADKNLQKNIRRVSLGLHYISWIPVLVVWCILWLVVLDMQFGQEVCHNPDGNELPSWVWSVLVTQFILFISFGYVQHVQFQKQFNIDSLLLCGTSLKYNPYFLEPNDSYDAAVVGLQTETAFLILSVVAKSTLGWIVYSQVLIFL
jgi:hypothetical protein